MTRWHSKRDPRRFDLALGSHQPLCGVLGAEVASEIAGQGMLVGEKSLREEIVVLRQELGDLTDDLRRRDEDLEGARQANRELMSELNRQRP